MNNTSNLKDTVSTVFGILGAVAGSILIAGQSGVVLPPIIITICGVISAISIGVIGWLTGKAPSAAKKTTGQVIEQNLPNP